jgi:hypothetical protein
VCGAVWSDTNGNGIQDAGEPYVSGAVVLVDGVRTEAPTDDNGRYEVFLGSGSHDIEIQVPPGTTPSPQNIGTDEALDSDGELIGENSVAHIFVDDNGNGPTNVDFGFVHASEIGTGTPGYWANHPEAWPASIVVGGKTYTSATAIPLIKAPDSKDKTLTLFASLISAKLNLANGTNGACISDTVTDADKWLMTYPVGTGVRASSYAWKGGEPFHRMLDNYNNGMLCAPHRD